MAWIRPAATRLAWKVPFREGFEVLSSSNPTRLAWKVPFQDGMKGLNSPDCYAARLTRPSQLRFPIIGL